MSASISTLVLSSLTQCLIKLSIQYHLLALHGLAERLLHRLDLGVVLDGDEPVGRPARHPDHEHAVLRDAAAQPRAVHVLGHGELGGNSIDFLFTLENWPEF